MILKHFLSISIVIVTLFSQSINAQSLKIELVKDIDTILNKNGVYPYTPMASYNGKIYFVGTNKTNNYELWVSDGTESGTHIVKDIVQGAIGSYPKSFVIYKDLLYFGITNQSNEKELWRSDGTEAGTNLVKQIPITSLKTMKVFKNKLWITSYFLNEYGDLIVSDGTEKGTKLFTGSDTINPLVTNARILAVTDSIMYLIGNITTSGFGTELIRTDGTEEGTKVINDLIEGPNGSENNPFGFLLTDKDIYYIAYSEKLNPPTKTVVQLWKSNGTAEGSKVLKNLNINYLPVYDYSFSNYENNVYFNTYNETLGFSGGVFNLWRTDGTEQGTIKFEKDSGNISLGFVSYNNNMYYLNGALHHEIWKTDGINKKFIYKTGFFDEKQAYIKSYIIDNKLYYLYSDNSLKTNYSDFIEISGDSAKSLVADIPNFLHINDIEKVGNTLFMKILTSDKGVELYKMTFTTDVKDIRELHQMSVFPNPSTDEFEFNAKDQGDLIIYNSSGQQVQSKKCNEIGNIKVSTKLTSGIYFINYTTKNDIYQSKLIIQ